MAKSISKARLQYESAIGPIFETSNLGKHDGQRFETMLDQARLLCNILSNSSSLDSFIILYVDKDTINAYANKISGQGLVGITPKLIFELDGYFEYLVTMEHLKFLNLNPEILTHLAFIFIIGHEVGHILLGHCDSSGQYARDEMQSITVSGSHVDSVVEELFADRFGAHFLFNYVTSLGAEVPRRPYFLFSLISMLSFFSIIRNDGKWMENFFDDTHPPAEFRSLFSSAQLMESFVLSKVITKEDAETAASSAIQIDHYGYFAKHGLTITKEQRFQYARLGNMQKEITNFILQRHGELHPDVNI
jgi:Peptidase family M48